MTFHVIEAGEPSIADEIDLVLARIEAVDDVMADRLRKYEQVFAAGAGQKIIAGPGKYTPFTS